MIAAGHPEAYQYPLGMLHDEAAIVSERENNKIVTEAQLLQLAVHSILAKEARKAFSKTVKSITVSTQPHKMLFEQGEVDGA